MKLTQFAKSLAHPARSAAGAVISLLVARLVGLPEVWWAPISAMVVMYSTVGPLTIAWQRWAGTAIGSAAGALLATCFGSGVVAYGCGVFVVGFVCTMLGLGKAASRFAAIALTIVMLVAHEGRVWTTAFHRFLEVSLGIAVGLVVAVLWPGPKEAKNS